MSSYSTQYRRDHPEWREAEKIRNNEPDKKRVMVAAMLAKTLKNVMETPVIDESGAIAAVSRQVLKEATIIMAALSVQYETL